MFPYKAPQPRDDKVITGVETRLTRRSRGTVKATLPVVQAPPTRRPNQYRRESAFGYNPYFGQAQNVSYAPDQNREEEDEEENKKISYSRNWFHIREELGHYKEDKGRDKFKRERARDKPKRQRERHMERDSRARSGVEELRKSLFSEQGSQDAGLSESEYSLHDDAVPPKYSLLPQDMYPTSDHRFDDSAVDYGLGYSFGEDGSLPPIEGDGSPSDSTTPQRFESKRRTEPKQRTLDRQDQRPQADQGSPACMPYPGGLGSGLSGCNYGYSPDMEEDGCLTQLCRALGKCMRWLCCPFVTYQEREEQIPEKCAPVNTCDYERS